MGPVQGIAIPAHHRPLGRAARIPGVDDSRLPLRHLSDHSFAGPDYSLLPGYRVSVQTGLDVRDGFIAISAD